MAYTIPDQTPYALALTPGELVVQLDTGELVAVRAIGSVEPNTGNTVIDARARPINGDGSEATDAAGNLLAASNYSTSLDAANLDLHGGIDGFRRLMVLTVLGEPAAWPHPREQDVLDHASIRTTLAAASNAGPAHDLAALL